MPGAPTTRPRLLAFLLVSPGYDSPTDGVPARSDDRADGTYANAYFETRLAQDANRSKVWRHLCRYLARWVGPGDDVLELGAGWCDFANHVQARHVVAMDLDATVERAAAGHVTAVVGDCTNLDRFDDASFDVVFASNLLEHLQREDSSRLLAGARRVLRPGGRLILMQPNFRLNPGRYFDDFTHVAIFTDQSLPDYLVSEGWTVDTVLARFLPLTLKSRGSNLTFLVPWYLRSPIKPLAGQMLVVATVPAGTTPGGAAHVER
jgi:cyclopropane fatty-acyl-phospholipid synthase-like methyltransferase